MKINLEINLDLWVARDRDNKLYIYKHKPRKQGGNWVSCNCYTMGYGVEYLDINTYEFVIPNIARYVDFSKVQWEDKKPKQLKDILIKEYE